MKKVEAKQPPPPSLEIRSDLVMPRSNRAASVYDAIPFDKMVPGNAVVFPADKKDRTDRIIVHIRKNWAAHKHAFVCRWMPLEGGVGIFCQAKEASKKRGRPKKTEKAKKRSRPAKKK